jgi:hypothetical protein
MSKSIQFLICIVLASSALAASIYFEPHHTCVRALIDDGSNRADANLYCAKWLNGK